MLFHAGKLKGQAPLIKQKDFEDLVNIQADVEYRGANILEMNSRNGGLMKKGALKRIFSNQTYLTLILILSCQLLRAQTLNESASHDTGGLRSLGSEASDGDRISSSLKFRGFRNALEDLPFMKEDWRVSFFQLASAETDRFDDHDSTSWFFYNYFSLNYKIDEQQRLAIRPVFRLESPGFNKYDEKIEKWKFTWDDLYISYSRFNLFEVGPFGTRANVRLYAPTSEFSQDIGLRTRIHPEFFMETSLGRNLGIELQFKGDYYFNGQRAYILKTQEGREIRLTNKEAEIESIAELKYRAHRLFYLKPRVAWHDEWNLNSPENNLWSQHTQEFTVAVGIEVRPTQNFNTTIQFGSVNEVYNNRNRDRRRGSNSRNPRIGDPSTHEIVALTNYRF